MTDYQQRLTVEDCYRVLGLQTGDNKDAVKKRFKLLARKIHPDKNANEQAADLFRVVKDAYDTILNYVEQTTTDWYGFKNHRTNENNNSSPKKKHIDPIRVKVEVTAEDVYNERPMKVSFSRRMSCTSCLGMGNDNSRSKRSNVVCTKCSSSGCGACEFRGSFHRFNGAFCEDCDGLGAMDQTVCITVPVNHSMSSCVIPNGGNTNSYGMAGDVVVDFCEKEHPVYKRDGNNIRVTQDVDLIDVLCGKTIYHRHISGRLIKLAFDTQGQPIEHGETRIIKQKGMPIPSTSGRYGDLYITFRIRLPTNGSLNDETIDQLKRILPNTTQEQEKKKKQFKLILV